MLLDSIYKTIITSRKYIFVSHLQDVLHNYVNITILSVTNVEEAKFNVVCLALFHSSFKSIQRSLVKKELLCHKSVDCLFDGKQLSAWSADCESRVAPHQLFTTNQQSIRAAAAPATANEQYFISRCDFLLMRSLCANCPVN